MENLPRLLNRNFPGNNHPLRDLFRLQRKMDRIFDDWTPGISEFDIAPIQGPAFTPSCDVQETENHFLLSFDLPGVKKENMKIDLNNDILTVSGERNEQRDKKESKSYQSKRFYGSFSRSFAVPSGLKPEQIEAQYADGVLNIAVPKMESSKAQQIKISEGKTGFFEKFLGHKKEESKDQTGSKPSSNVKIA